jgi:hypothetical protein
MNDKPRRQVGPFSIPVDRLPAAALAQEAIERAARPKLSPLERELADRLEELLEYSDNLRGSSVHKRCTDTLAKARPVNGGTK